MLFFVLLFSLSQAAQVNIRPYVINTEQTVLDDLQRRLYFPRYFPVFEEGWDYGANMSYVKDVVTYWGTQFPWRKIEQQLNEMSQYMSLIDGMKIHYVHMKSLRKDAQPLIILHGWPGSFWECSKIINYFTNATDSDMAFHVVCPSLPGYGFSSPPLVAGFDQLEAAKVMIKLMQILGYDKYYVQGGDWGSIVGALMAVTAPQNVIGFHTNFPLGAVPYTKGVVGILHSIAVAIAPSFMLPEEELPFWKEQTDIKEVLTQTGYFHLQATKPHSISLALNDSPIGLAAFIIEKFQRWSDCDGNVENVFSKDDLLTNIMIYWVTNSIASSQRFYYELFHGKNNVYGMISSLKVEVPVGCSVFPHELFPAIRSFAEYTYSNILVWKRHKRGGHFAAMEVPEVLANDVREFRREVEKSKKKEELKK